MHIVLIIIKLLQRTLYKEQVPDVFGLYQRLSLELVSVKLQKVVFLSEVSGTFKSLNLVFIPIIIVDIKKKKQTK